MTHKLLLLSLLTISSLAFSMIQLDKKTFKSPKHLNNLTVLHKDDQIFVKQGDNAPVLVNMLGDTLKKGTALKIKQVKQGKSFFSVDEINGQYRIELKEKLKGGGMFGAAAGVWLGAGLVNLVCYGSIALVCTGVGLVCPPAGVALGLTLAPTLTGPIQALATVGAVSGGVIGGVVTGPI